VYGLGVCAEFGGSVFKPLVGGTAGYINRLPKKKKLYFIE